MPTGTLANQLAVRALSGGSGRVVVQEESHLYNDSGDCVQTLSGLNLIPLGRDRSTFTLDELEEAINNHEQADALVDAIYYICDTAVRHGLNLDPLFSVVHRCH